jgi:hypothetical protein
MPPNVTDARTSGCRFDVIYHKPASELIPQARLCRHLSDMMDRDR